MTPGERNALRIAAALNQYSPEVLELKRRADAIKAVGERFANASLDNYEVYHDAQKPVITRLRTIAADMEAFVANRSNLFFFGTAGAGKDHLMAAMILLAGQGKVIQGVEVLRNKQSTLFSECTDVFGISDPLPPVGRAAQRELPRLFDLVDDRYRRKQSTWVTINAKTLEEAEERLGTPIYERLVHGAIVLPCLWPSYRTRGMKAPSTCPEASGD
jgi:DNA replication protein DnaC